MKKPNHARTMEVFFGFHPLNGSIINDTLKSVILPGKHATDVWIVKIGPPIFPQLTVTAERPYTLNGPTFPLKIAPSDG